MHLNLEKGFISSLEKKLNNYGFVQKEVELKGSVHTAHFLLHSKGINYSFLVRILPKRLKFDIYFKVEYIALSEIIKKISSMPKYKYSFTEKLADFLDPENSDWFRNTTSLDDEKIDVQDESDIERLVDHIESKYVKVIFDVIIPRIDSLDKLNGLLNNYDLVYDRENDEPKMYVLSGGMIFQSISALILNTLYDNPQREELIKMYSWLYNVIKDDENTDKIMLGNVLTYVDQRNI